MIEQEKFEFLQNLYKTLRKHDEDILKHFCDENLSDNDYFFYGISSDIFSNAINVLTNYLSGNLESAGVDLSCRTIIEALVILHMDAAGQISDKQKQIYRYLYAYVDIDNFHSVMTDEAKQTERVKRVYADKEKCEKAMMEHFGCTEKDLKNWKIGVDDPCFYLKTSLKGDIRFSKLIEKYPVRNEDDLKMYEFFSLFIHPRCEMNQQIENAVMDVRNIYIDNVLNIVYDYLKECKLMLDDEKRPNFDEDFWYNPLLQNNVHNVKDIEFVFHHLMGQFVKLKDGDDMFTWHFLEKSKYLVMDMMISESLGFKEHVISTFKSFIEEYAVFHEINSISDMNDFKYAKKCFWCASRLQIDSHFQELGWKDGTVPESEIKALYDEYYKEKFGLKQYKDFYCGLRRNSLYCLGNDKKSYNRSVRNMIEEVFTDELMSKDVMTLYRISKDMSHASGYNFNASEGIINVYYHKAMLCVWQLLNFYIANHALTLSEHGEERDVKFVVSCLKLFAEAEAQSIKQVYDDFNTPNDKKIIPDA